MGYNNHDVAANRLHHVKEYNNTLLIYSFGFSIESFFYVR